MSYPINFSGSTQIEVVNGTNLTPFTQAYSSNEILYICGTGPATIFTVGLNGFLNQLETKVTGTPALINAAYPSYFFRLSGSDIVSINGNTKHNAGDYLFPIESIKQVIAKAPYLNSNSTLYINVKGQTLEVETISTISIISLYLSTQQPTWFTPLGTFASHAAISLNGIKTTANFILNNDCIVSKGLLQGDATKTKTEYTGYEGEPFTLITVS
jgi:hypothetical protein